MFDSHLSSDQEEKGYPPSLFSKSKATSALKRPQLAQRRAGASTEQLLLLRCLAQALPCAAEGPSHLPAQPRQQAS